MTSRNSIAALRPLVSFPHLTRSAAPRRTLSSSISLQKSHKLDGEEPSSGSQGQTKHVLSKDNKLDVQSEAKSKAFEARASGTGGTATEQKDAQRSKEKTKKEYPEAPVTIGMQDERGARGNQ